MAILCFEKQKANRRKLLAYGFEARGDALVLCRDIADGQMRLDIVVRPDGTLETKVTDIAADEEYVLHLVSGASGSFVGRVRSDYQRVLDEVRDCYDPTAFGSGQAKKLVEYVRTQYGDEPEFLWEKSPDCAIWRRADNRKWYGVLMVVSRRKFGFASDERVEVVNFRHNAEHDGTIADGQRYFPAYHMNKTHWVSAILDGHIPMEELVERIDRSYIAARKKG